MAENYRVKMKGISKSFGGVHALKNVDFQVLPGEVHALMGENGAGKSTLMKVLAGSLQKDEGQIFIEGKEVSIHNPDDAMRNGVSIVYQEHALASDLTVAENIYLRELKKKKIVDWKKLNADAAALLNDLGFHKIKPTDTVGDLSVAYQQVIEICKAISSTCSVLILDEPTAVLATSEVEQLFALIERLKQKNVSIIYISHRIDEVHRIADRLTTLRDGVYVGTRSAKDITDDQIVEMMIGRNMDEIFPQKTSTPGEVVLEVRDLCRGRQVQHISFNVRAGEIVGMSGLVGSGRTETVRAIFGADKLESGTILVHGKEERIKSPRQAVKKGIGLLPENRKEEGLVLDIPIAQNITLSCIEKVCNSIGVLRKKSETEIVDRLVRDLQIKTSDSRNNVSSLSGGNQQKVAIGKWLASECKILILDEPTRGVDVGAKFEMFKLINELATNGVAIIMISSYMPELIGLCDRILVMNEGHLKGQLMRPDFSEKNILDMALR